MVTPTLFFIVIKSPRPLLLSPLPLYRPVLPPFLSAPFNGLLTALSAFGLSLHPAHFSQGTRVSFPNQPPVVLLAKIKILYHSSISTNTMILPCVRHHCRCWDVAVNKVKFFLSLILAPLGLEVGWVISLFLTACPRLLSSFLNKHSPLPPYLKILAPVTLSSNILIINHYNKMFFFQFKKSPFEQTLTKTAFWSTLVKVFLNF